MKSKRSLGRLAPILVVVAVLVSCLTCGVVWAQGTAQIMGTVHDESGGVVPGVTVTVTQTATQITRQTVTNASGSYILVDLRVGPYRLEAVLSGFKTYVESSILLQVGSTAVLNPVLALGELSDVVEVKGAVVLTQLGSTGVGQVIDNARVEQMPLNGRQVQQLVILSGAAVSGGAQQDGRSYPSLSISVAGGSTNGLEYQLDGVSHNEPAQNLTYPLPFPDALQEFKVETSGVQAQYGNHSAAVVNAVTKSGTNRFHGDTFEFNRDAALAAKNAFATTKDNLKRNQFGGVLGGPIVTNKLFFFGGYQGTIQHSSPAALTSYTVTPAMLAGDWTTVTSPACTSSGKQITLKAPFVNNRIDPSLYSGVALNLVPHLPSPVDACGRAPYTQRTDYDEHLAVGKIDYQASRNHLLSARYQFARRDAPNNYDGVNIFSLSVGALAQQVQSFALGSTYIMGPNTVGSLRAMVNRAMNAKVPDRDMFTLSDLGVKNVYTPPGTEGIAQIDTTGAGNILGRDATPASTNSASYELAGDLTLMRGPHQIKFGGSFIHSSVYYTSNSSAPGIFGFTGATTGMGLADLMIGKPNTFTQGNSEVINEGANVVALFVQDTWKPTSHLTVNAGLRWDPQLWFYDRDWENINFNRALFDQGIHSTVFPAAPAGMEYAGDAGMPKTFAVTTPNRWWNFAPRLGLAYDPKGDGRLVIRSAYGLFFDSPNLIQALGLKYNSPRGLNIILNSPSFENPWGTYPGGNPFPLSREQPKFLPFANYTWYPQGLQTPRFHQFNVNVQKELGTAWSVAASYIGSRGSHIIDFIEANPAVYDPRPTCVIAGKTYTPCSTVANTNARRTLSLEDPVNGQYYAIMEQVTDRGVSDYNGLVLSVARRASDVNVLANYTLSRCKDTAAFSPRIREISGMTAERQDLNYGNCELDRTHNFNMSVVYQTPKFGGSTLRLVASDWQVSGILSVRSGAYLTVLTGIDNALTGTQTDQWPNQVLGSPYPAQQSASLWLNPAAFQQPTTGTYGTAGRSDVVGPGTVTLDLGVTRRFSIKEGHDIQVRVEAFNAMNHVNLGNPTLNMSNSQFGRILSAADPRIVQIALKYSF